MSHPILVCEGYPLPHAILCPGLAGRDLTEYSMMIHRAGHSFTTTAECGSVRDDTDKLYHIALYFDTVMKSASDSSYKRKPMSYQALVKKVIVSTKPANTVVKALCRARIRTAEYCVQQLKEFDCKKLKSTTKKAWTLRTSTRRRNWRN